ncbi:MAG: bifunctional pyr operon transcriptional regulator/uracil phosphoribosyltransferase PyrR [Acholeplasmataceae bacterium]|nr:bifunctional pyr operon transcriptional regulator/uracil phosphoribosyltransferase PyrR [Acholeplasmataceae bacterium]
MKTLMTRADIERTLRRMAHEIIERNPDLDNIVLLGIKNKGVPIANALGANLKRFTDHDIPVHELDILAYRDDIRQAERPTNEGWSVSDKTVILVDDVLYTGRSARAAMDAASDHGRPRGIQLAILVDRGHRELPIRPDYVGLNVPTSKQERVVVDKALESVTITLI